MRITNLEILEEISKRIVQCFDFLCICVYAKDLAECSTLESLLDVRAHLIHESQIFVSYCRNLIPLGYLYTFQDLQWHHTNAHPS